MRATRYILLSLFALALVWAQFRGSGDPTLSARLELITEPNMPVRVYLFKGDRPFRLNPVEAMLPLRVDLFYRERLWRNSADPDTLEVTCKDQSHFFLLKGRAQFDLPAGDYRVEAYRGLFYEPFQHEFTLAAGKPLTVTLAMRNWLGAGESQQWISGDDHIHITRAAEDNDVYLRWLEAEDLSVANFLQLQRQMDASVQYAFGPAGEAKRASHVIRSGHESRSEFYGHLNFLGGEKMIRPLSIGNVYANSPDAYPYPAELFAQAHQVGATVGYAHFDGSVRHSALLMDLALETLDFVEVFQFGVLKTTQWYEVLNAGLRVTGIAGSDFPVSLNRPAEVPRWLPLLGPERTLVKAAAGASPYEAWAAGVRNGNVVVSNGPIVELTANREAATVTATASFFRPLLILEIVRNGEVIATTEGDGARRSLQLTTPIKEGESCWVAARVKAQKEDNEPDIQAHTNPTYFLHNNQPVMISSDREALATRWQKELEYYRTANLVFPNEAQKTKFFNRAQQALDILRRAPGS